MWLFWSPGRDSTSLKMAWESSTGVDVEAGTVAVSMKSKEQVPCSMCSLQG